MRRMFLSLLPTAAAVAVLAGACGSGGGSADPLPTPQPTISPTGTNFRTIPPPPTTLSNTAPIAGAGEPGAATPDTYTIVAGDFPIKVGKMFGCDWDVIANFQDPPLEKFPFPGDEIQIPTSECAGAGATDPATAATNADAPASSAPPATIGPDGTFPYKVAAGDTLFGIATAFDVSMDAIMAANGAAGGDPNNFVLVPGEEIKIPSPPTTG